MSDDLLHTSYIGTQYRRETIAANESSPRCVTQVRLLGWRGLLFVESIVSVEVVRRMTCFTLHIHPTRSHLSGTFLAGGSDDFVGFVVIAACAAWITIVAIPIAVTITRAVTVSITVTIGIGAANTNQHRSQ